MIKNLKVYLYLFLSLLLLATYAFYKAKLEYYFQEIQKRDIVIKKLNIENAKLKSNLKTKNFTLNELKKKEKVENEIRQKLENNKNSECNCSIGKHIITIN